MRSVSVVNDAPSDAIDLDAYLARIGHEGPLTPTLETLRALHRAHATAIPFENLDILLGRPIRLDLASLQSKLVTARRGGYCFEQNTLFAAVLRRVGFRVTTLAARVRYTMTTLLPKTHMAIAVDLAPARYLADVGFGGHGLVEPLELVPDRAQQLATDWYRVAVDAEKQGPLVLQAKLPDGWTDLYAFTLEEHFPVDYEMANHYTSTHPSSRFVVEPRAARITPAGERVHVRGHKATVRRDGAIVEERDLSPSGLLDVLRDRFGIDLPAGTRFRPPPLC